MLNVELVKSPKVCAWEIAEVNPTLDTENRMAESAFEILEATAKSIVSRPVLADGTGEDQLQTTDYRSPITSYCSASLVKACIVLIILLRMTGSVKSRGIPIGIDRIR